jgi:hypothetical protein
MIALPILFEYARTRLNDDRGQVHLQRRGNLDQHDTYYYTSYTFQLKLNGRSMN